MKIISADERLAEKRGAKIAITGPFNIGKTSLLRTLDQSMLDETLFVDIEAGDLSVRDVNVASVRPGKWPELVDLACALGGPNPALPPTAAYSQAHFDAVMSNPELAELIRFNTLFIDSITDTARRCFQWCEQQPESLSERGKKDLRGTYGLLGRSMIAWLQQLQHARDKNVIFVSLLEQVTDDFNVKSWQLQIEGNQTRSQLPGIVDEMITMAFVHFDGDSRPTRTFVCADNPWGYPTKDRSGRLQQFEEPHLGRLLTKLLSQQPPSSRKENDNV
jgi:AAA domain